MAASDEKLSKFNLAINHYAEEQREKIQKEVEEYKRRELEKAEAEVLADAYQLIQKEMAEMRAGIARELSRREMDSRKELLAKRQQITDEVFEKVADKLLAFTKSGEYAAFLERTARKLADSFRIPGTVLCIKAEDAVYEKNIADAFHYDCTCKTVDDIAIGGIRVYNHDAGIMADETLDTMLESQHEWFEQHSGMRVL